VGKPALYERLLQPQEGTEGGIVRTQFY